MCSTAILAVGLDSPMTEVDRRTWQSEGYFVTWTNSIREAIEWFRVGDFDLVLLGGSIPPESRERLAFLIRASGSNTPVVSIADSRSDCDAVDDATSGHEPKEVFRRIGEILASNTRSDQRSRTRQLLVRKRAGDTIYNSIKLGWIVPYSLSVVSRFLTVNAFAKCRMFPNDTAVRGRLRRKFDGRFELRS